MKNYSKNFKPITPGQVLEIAAVTMGIIGAYLCAMKIPTAFLIWTGTNPVFLYFSLKRREYYMALVWVAYLGSAIYGLITW